MSCKHFCENFFLESMHIHFFKSQALYLTTLHLVQSLQHFPAVASESLHFNPADYAVQPESYIKPGHETVGMCASVIEIDHGYVIKYSSIT